MVAKAVVPGLVLAWAATTAPQVTITVPEPPVVGQVVPQGERNYGKPRIAELESIVFAPESYQNAHVITLGVLDILVANRYWSLRDASATVLLLPTYVIGASDLDSLVRSRVEIRGIVRAIKPKEYLRGVDTDLLLHPTLPVLPAPSQELPRVSITVLAFADRGDRGHGTTKGPAGTFVRDVLENPAEYAGKKVSLRGQFRGSNLFGDLPPATQRSRSDWVLKDGDTALWVTGKAPRGRGWALDPSYKGDAVRWLEVVGQAQVANGVVYLQASKVALSSARDVETAEDDPR
jgi:hypothetical protein